LAVCRPVEPPWLKGPEGPTNPDRLYPQNPPPVPDPMPTGEPAHIKSGPRGKAFRAQRLGYSRFRLSPGPPQPRPLPSVDPRFLNRPLRREARKVGDAPSHLPPYPQAMPRKADPAIRPATRQPSPDRSPSMPEGTYVNVTVPGCVRDYREPESGRNRN
jgi:hypothetical protein